MSKPEKTMEKIQEKDGNIAFELGVVLIKEGASFIAYVPALDLSTHGDSEADALDAAKVSADLFLEGLHALGTFNEVLVDLGWQKEEESDDTCLVPPEVIHAYRTVRVSCHA